MRSTLVVSFDISDTDLEFHGKNLGLSLSRALESVVSTEEGRMTDALKKVDCVGKVRIERVSGAMKVNA